jgi:UDP-N-acetylglucosamine 4,6-dehydratase
MNLKNKEILITGGTGSLGNALTEILCQSNIRGLRILSRDELKQHEMATRFKEKSTVPIAFHIGDVRDQERLNMAFAGVDIVIHAAALKQVPVGEKDPLEVVKTNIIGAQNVINASLYNVVERVMLISTDKAVNPINLYGSTKLCAEKIFINAKVYSPHRYTKFSVSRYGNIMASRGSVIPLFLQQAKNGESLTVTNEKMTRFFTSLPFVANFILEQIEDMEGGEIFVPKMPSCYIMDLAKTLAPNSDISIIGSRPGEKLDEILINEYEALNTIDKGDYYIITQSKQENSIQEYSSGNSENLLSRFRIKELVGEYL